MSRACPLDGNLRTVVESDRYSAAYHCGWCGTWSREEVELDSRDLMTDAGRRD